MTSVELEIRVAVSDNVAAALAVAGRAWRKGERTVPCTARRGSLTIVESLQVVAAAPKKVSRGGKRDTFSKFAALYFVSKSHQHNHTFVGIEGCGCCCCDWSSPHVRLEHGRVEDRK